MNGILAVVVLLCPGLSGAQAPRPLTPPQNLRIDEIVKSMTLQQKIDFIGGTGFAVRPEPELKIPALEMSDGPYGVRSNTGFPSTTYAAGISLAASWDRSLAVAVGAGIGRDARARGVHFMLGPGVNIYRSPRNGRNFEYFGEDPFLASAMAVGYITGMQEQGVSATVKHYLGNNSEYLRHDSDTIVDERTAREICLPAFEAAVKQAHVGAVMDSYNLINGRHATENGYFNIDVLRKDWAFKGVLMSDWDATYDAVGAANGGLDIEMPTGKFMNYTNLKPAVDAGKVTEATIDEKVRHILTTAMAFGWLERDQQESSISFLDARNQAAALQGAREGAVLLKNTGSLLPLNKNTVKSILVVGPDAYPAVPVGGGSAGVVPFRSTSAFLGLADELGQGSTVLYNPGLPTMNDIVNGTMWSTAASNGERGVTVETFANPDLSGSPTSSTERHMKIEGLSIKLLMDDIENAMAIFMAPPKKASHRLTGYFDAAEAGKYIVVAEGAGEGSGNRVYVDDKLVIDNWDLVRAFQPHVTLDFSAGAHKVVVEQKQTGSFGGHFALGIVAASEVVNKQAIELASHADAVLVEAGFAQESESEGGDRTFALPYGQDELISAMAQANPKTIVAVTSGGNVDSRAWIDTVPALLETWYAGQEGGRALAEILFGDVNPSGHLPATFERNPEDNPTYTNYYPETGTNRVVYKEGIFVGYRGYEKNKTTPLFPFGFGLSYTTFAFTNLTVTPTPGDATAIITFDVTNTGNREGAEVAQVYVTENHPPVERPEHELKGFVRLDLKPGETKHVSIDLDSRAFSYYDVKSKSWLVGGDNFTVSVGDSVAELPLKTEVHLAIAN
ncbi:MAG: glycoside hydrolase family 3 C-terminal domain-containing protein [Silvibacterium sp.]